MNISEISIKRPVFATILNLIVVVFGLFSLPRLAVDLYPDVDFPVVSVSVIYPGADPESIEQRILDPLEDALNGISGLKTLASNGFPNVGQIILQFDLEKNSDEAAQEVRDKVFATVGQLPDEAETPIVQKFDMGSAPILNMALRGEGELADLSALAKDVVIPSLERIDGVARVTPAGMREREIHILLNLERMSAFGLTPADVANSVRMQNMDLPSGKVENDTNYRTIRIKGRLSSAQEIASLPVISSRNSNIRISDVAEVRDTIEDATTAAFVGREPTILLALQKQSGSNTTAVADDARAAVAKLASSLPAGAKLEIVTDNSVFIKGSIDAVKLDLVVGAILAILIVLVFLRDWRVTFISAMALPTAVIGTFAFMQYMGFTLNMMSTLALSLSIGILIDDAIIVVENIHRHLSMGKTGKQAAADASREIGLAVIATTLTLCAVFVPVAFMEGIMGRFFYQFGLTVAFAVLVSLFVAFTLTPMLASKFLVSHEGDHHADDKAAKAPSLLGRMSQATEAVLTKLDDAYRSTLRWCLKHRMVTIGGGVVTFVLSIVMLSFVPVAFFPKEDRGEFSISYKLPEGRSLEFTQRQSLDLADAVKAYPGVANVITSIAASGDRKPNKARIEVKLVAKEQRDYTQAQMMERLRAHLTPVFAVEGSELVINENANGGGGRSEPIQLIFKSEKWDELTAFTDKVEAYIRENIPEAVDTATTKPKPQEEYRVTIDTAKAADLSLTPAAVAQTVRALFEGEKVGDILQNGRTIDVNLRVASEQRLSQQDIAGVSLTNGKGEFIPLNSVAAIERAESPSAIERYDGRRQITVVSNFTGKDLNAAVNKIQTYVNANIPPTITMSLSGQAEIMKDSIMAMMRALFLAILLVFMVLCAQYESYLAPVVIMAALPLSMTGAFGGLLLTGQVMSVYTMIGIILLMGLVTKNGILLIDFTIQRMGEGLSIDEALLEAGPIRLRPILMTTFAAGGGMLPVAIGHGVGGEARSPMGVAVIGGLLVSTVLTLVVVPCLFSLAMGARQSLAARFARRRQRAASRTFAAAEAQAMPSSSSFTSKFKRGGKN